MHNSICHINDQLPICILPIHIGDIYQMQILVCTKIAYMWSIEYKVITKVDRVQKLIPRSIEYKVITKIDRVQGYYQDR